MTLIDISGKTKEEHLTADLEKAQAGLGTEVGAQFRKNLAEKLTLENDAKIKAEIAQETTSAEFMGYMGKTLEIWLGLFPKEYTAALVISKKEEGTPVDIIISAGNNLTLEDIGASVDRSIKFRNDQIRKELKNEQILKEIV